MCYAPKKYEKKLVDNPFLHSTTMSMETSRPSLGGLYPAPLFHMESMWNPYGIHVVPHGICPFHMESAHSTWNMFWLRSHPFWWFLSTYIPCGFHVDSTIPHGISTRNPYGMFHMNSILFPCGFHVDSTWNPQQPILE